MWGASWRRLNVKINGSTFTASTFRFNINISSQSLVRFFTSTWSTVRQWWIWRRARLARRDADDRPRLQSVSRPGTVHKCCQLENPRKSPEIPATRSPNPYFSGEIPVFSVIVSWMISLILRAGYLCCLFRDTWVAEVRFARLELIFSFRKKCFYRVFFQRGWNRGSQIFEESRESKSMEKLDWFL